MNEPTGQMKGPSLEVLDKLVKRHMVVAFAAGARRLAQGGTRGTALAKLTAHVC
jgi:hypothetical protein